LFHISHILCRHDILPAFDGPLAF